MSKTLNYGRAVLLLSSIILLVSFSRSEAEIGFRRVTPSDRLVDPTRYSPAIGFSSSIADSILIDTIATTTATKDSTYAVIDTTRIQLQLIDSTGTTPKQSTGSDTLSAIPLPDGIIIDPVAIDTISEPEEELIFRTTALLRTDLPIVISAKHDTTTDFIVLSQKLSGSELPIQGALSSDQYLKRASEAADREIWQKSVRDRLPIKKEREGEGIVISIPIIRSGKKKQKFDQTVERIIGGNDVTLTVSGNIRVDGEMRMIKREELRDDADQTSYNFKVNQTQQFNIKGKIGEKVDVAIDQDSDRLFDFENNLSVRYTGYEGEIVKSIEAGNVSLSLRGARLASASTQNKGLFGFKTVSQLGALSLTTIASLEKAQKNQITIDGGAKGGNWRVIRPQDFVQGRYYFLDDHYREQYKVRDAETLENLTSSTDPYSVFELHVWVSVDNNDLIAWDQSINAWALFDPDPNKFDSTAENSELVHQANFIRLKEGTDYTSYPNLGYIRLTSTIPNTKALAVAYSTRSAGTFGDLEVSDNPGAVNIFKLLQPDNPQPPDSFDDPSTWNLMWRNVYDLGATGIEFEGFEGKITGLDDNGKPGSESRVDTEGNNRRFIEIFDLDNFGADGSIEPDGQIDNLFVKTEYGELIFPDLQPFAPEGWETLPFEEHKAELDSSIQIPKLYTGPATGLRNISTDFKISVKYTSASASYSLGYNVLEGSEEVYRGGTRLVNGTDYTIDYNTGELNLVGSVSAADNIEIRYEQGQFFQLATKTLLGLHAEYELWENSYIGTTLLSFNEKSLDQRVQVGGEPIQNAIWDVNTKLTFQPDFLTRAVDWLPLIETDKPSTFSLNAEFAQVFPNPNGINSPSTGDNNGVAYLDDFESIRRSTPLGVSRLQWSPASFPEYDRNGPLQWAKQRGRLIWYNPIDQVKIEEIWPERQTTASNATTTVLDIEYQPWWTEWDGDKPPEIDPTQSWGGIMRYLGAGYADQSDSKYLEVWLHRPSSANGMMYVDLGNISEDVIPDGRLNTEDEPTGGRSFGDGNVDEVEDIGLDMMIGSDDSETPDSALINGGDIYLPSYDDWSYGASSKNYSHINGSEGNRTSESGRRPDTEDISGNHLLETSNSFLRYAIDLSEGDNNQYIVGGKGINNGWRLYRIPLVDTLNVNGGSVTTMEFVRVWFTGFRQPTRIRIAEIDIVGNEWREVIEPNGYEPISIAVANTHDNPDTEEARGYYPPPGVAGEIDPVTNLRAQEQSLVLRINDLGSGESGSVKKTWERQSRNLLRYRKLKMFVNGGGATSPERFKELDLWMHLRLGSGGDLTSRYYEYSQRLHQGWDKENEIVIDFDRLASLKFLRQQDSLGLRDYDILPNGDVLRIVGEPSLDNISVLTIGVENHGRPISTDENIEIWVDELRVSDVKRDPSISASGGFDLRIAQNLLTFQGSLTSKQADFHSVQSNSTTDADELSGNLTAGVDLAQLFNPLWGLKLPVRATINNSIKIPKYQPDSDIELSAISSQQPNIWGLFNDNLLNNDHLTSDPSTYGSPVDSMMTTSKWYNLSFEASKSKKSENPFIRYTIDGISFKNFSFKETWNSSPSVQSQYSRKITGATSYNLSFDKPVEFAWLKWAESIPILNRVSESVLKPFPNSLNFNMNGSENIGNEIRRKLTVSTPKNTLDINRSFGTKWKPIPIFDVSFDQTVGSSRISDPLVRYKISEEAVNLVDSLYITKYFDDEGVLDSTVFDSARWNHDLELAILDKEGKIFWKAFGSSFLDNNLSQTFSTRFSPVLFSWLETNSTYGSRYTWSWGNPYGAGRRTVVSSPTLSADLTLKLNEILNIMESWSQDDGQDENRELPMGMPEPGHIGSPQSGEIESPFNEMPIPGDLPPPSSSSLSGVPDVKGENIENIFTGDTTSTDTTEVTGELKRPSLKLDLLAPAKFILGRLGNIRYSFSKSDRITNNSVGPGQADWKFKLGLSEDSGLEKAEGYSTPNSRSISTDHQISSGFNITENINISSISFRVSETETHSINFDQKNISGNQSLTSIYLFDSDDLNIIDLPGVNWSATWSGWETLPFINQFANSISFNNSFQGQKTEDWIMSPDTAGNIIKKVNNTNFTKSFTPLLGISFGWKGNVSSSIRYNLSQSASQGFAGTKSRSITRTITGSASYNLRRGFKLPFWPFRNIKFDNSTSFGIAYNNSLNEREQSSANAPFASSGGKTESWSIAPSMDYTFSKTVRGNFSWEYAVQNSEAAGKTTSQILKFSVNISIRG